MEVRYTKHNIYTSPIQRKMSRISLQVYSQVLDTPVIQGISNLYHDIFSKFYDLVVPFFTIEYNKIIKLLVEENVPAESEVLDLCTGTGNVAFAAAKKAKEVIRLDSSQRMLSKARKRLKDMEFET